MSKIEKVKLIESIAAGEIDPLQQKQKFWLFKAGEVFRILESGDLVRSTPEHFARFNGVNDVSFCHINESLPSDVLGQFIRSANPDSLHDLAEQYLRLGNKNFKLKKK